MVMFSRARAFADGHNRRRRAQLDGRHFFSSRPLKLVPMLQLIASSKQTFRKLYVLKSAGTQQIASIGPGESVLRVKVASNFYGSISKLDKLRADRALCDRNSNKLTSCNSRHRDLSLCFVCVESMTSEINRSVSSQAAKQFRASSSVARSHFDSLNCILLLL